MVVEAIMSLLGIGGKAVETYQRRQLAKQEHKFQLERIRAEGEREAAMALAETEAQYDNIAQRNMKTTWKDEYLVLVFTAPMIVSFLIPFIHVFWGIDLTPQLRQSWALISSAPAWYQYTVWGIVIATFGLRWAVNHVKGKIIREGKANEHTSTG